MTAFDKFITDNHRGADMQDIRILGEWGTFKAMIQKAPADTQGHNKHVNALRNALLKEEVSKHLGTMDKAVVEKDDNEKTIEIDKNKLLQISRELKRNVLRHTKDPLNLLD